ncbi:MAG: glycosyltransferase family 2 protein [Anaerolineae bacterium]|jgi:GT2 family glycosyltransferase
MDLAVITVSYNTRELLAESLSSVHESLARSGLAGQIWVVDNASADGSADMVRERFPDVCLVAHDENVGFAAGNNLALEEMGFGLAVVPRHVLFLNPDTRVVGDALGEMVRFLDATREAGAAGARLVHGDGSFQHSAFAFPGLMQIFFDFFPLHHRLLDSRLNGRYPRRLYEAGRPFPVDHPLGAALMVRGETLEQVGGFDEQFFMYCEEIDLCRRIRARGWKVYCVPRAEIVHHVAQSTHQFRHRMLVALWRSRYLMFDRYQGPLFGWLARRLVRLGLWAEARRARAAFRSGSISAEELARRTEAFREVVAL